MTHWEDDDETRAALMKAAMGGRLSRYLFERSRARDRALIAESDRWHWWLFVLMPVRFLAYLGSVIVLTRVDQDSLWWLAAIIVLAVVASQGILGGLARAQSYRNGWVDRGRHDLTLHTMVCGDPVAQEQFERAMLATNADAFKRG